MIDALEFTRDHVHKDTGSVRQEVGRILQRVESGYWVAVGHQRLHAKQAASCLVRPDRDDRVLLATQDGERSYILAILDQADASSSELELQGDTTIRSSSGRLRIAAVEGVDIVSQKDVSVTSKGFNLRAAGASLLVDTLEHFGNRVFTDVHELRAKVAALDTVAGRISQRAQRVYRTVEDLEHLRVGQLDISAKKNLRMHAENALLTALSLVKVDGEQIHMG
jgi:hypothetical protein